MHLLIIDGKLVTEERGQMIEDREQRTDRNDKIHHALQNYSTNYEIGIRG